MQITSTASTTASTPQSPSVSRLTGPGEPSAFAKLLSKQPPASHAEARKEASREASRDRPADEAQRAQNARRNAAQGTARDARAARPPEPAKPQSASSGSETDAAARPDAAAAEEEDTSESAIAASGSEALPVDPHPPWRAHAAMTPAGGGSDPQSDASGSETDLATASVAPLPGAGRGHSGGPAHAALAAARAGKPEEPGESGTDIPRAGEQAKADIDAPASRLAAVSSDAGAQRDMRAERVGSAEPFSLAGVAGLQNTLHSEGAPSLAAPATINIPTPATAPEFRQALGVQVSVLVRDGVQRAELHLNPADMGPISVQIALEGSNAQVDFGADLSATRSLIEAGLPELAAALREAGFTLSGGGVSQHSRGDRQGEAAPRGEPGTRANGPTREPAPQRVSARVGQGAVDLYA